MTRDPKRARLAALLRENDLSLARVSAAIGMNTTYLQQYLGRGMAKVLASKDTEAFARLLGCDPSELQHDARSPPASITRTKRTRRRLPAVAAVPEITLNRHTDLDAILGAPDPHEAFWRIPVPVLRYEKHADPAHIRIPKIEDDMMMPELHPSNRVVFDTSRL